MTKALDLQVLLVQSLLHQIWYCEYVSWQRGILCSDIHLNDLVKGQLQPIITEKL